MLPLRFRLIRSRSSWVPGKAPAWSRVQKPCRSVVVIVVVVIRVMKLGRYNIKFTLCRVARAADCTLPIIRRQITRSLLVAFDQSNVLVSARPSSDERVFQRRVLTTKLQRLGRSWLYSFALAIISVHHQRLKIDCCTRRRNHRSSTFINSN